MRRSIIRFVALFSLMMLDVLGGASEAAAGYAFAVGTAETGVGIAAGVAVGLHGTDVAYAGYRTMMDGASYDSLTSRGLQAVGVPQGWANGIDVGVSVAGSAGVGLAVRTATQACAASSRMAANKIVNGDRVGSGLKVDVSHRAASYLSESQLSAGQTFTIKGGDGVNRVLLQTNGKMNGNSGIFEYILDPSGKVTHQRFIPGGVITGYPNQ